jgi:hypothetical protein
MRDAETLKCGVELQFFLAGEGGFCNGAPESVGQKGDYEEMSVALLNPIRVKSRVMRSQNSDDGRGVAVIAPFD